MPEPGDSTADATPSAGAIALDVVLDAGDWSQFGAVEALIEEAGRALAAHPLLGACANSEACIALSDDDAVRRLNAAYRSKDKPTNVLSFPAGECGVAPSHRRLLGDIVLAESTILREAAEQGIPPRHHLQHLVVHGLLHLMGYDHESDAEAREMESIETQILATLGIADPYAEPALETPADPS